VKEPLPGSSVRTKTRITSIYLGQAQMEVSDWWVVYLLLCKCYQRPTTTSRLYRYVARTFRRCAACSSSHVLYHQRPDAFWLTAVQRAMDIGHRALPSRPFPSHRSQGWLQQALFARSGSGSTRWHCSFYGWSERHDVQQRLPGLLLAFKVSARGRWNFGGTFSGSNQTI
jgi:hypothetical protein